jgi:NADH dehydrogenase [ubiquinone] 1 alpha subcomplex assembly factor 7
MDIITFVNTSLSCSLTVTPTHFLNYFRIFPSAKEGDLLELSLDGLAYADKMAEILDKTKGAALIIDYGEDQPLQDSLRAIRQHQFVDIFDGPGSADLSVLVDFSSLKKCFSKFPSLQMHGPIGQGKFLMEMGIEHRSQALTQKANEEQKRQIESSYHRLTDPKEMGEKYKVLGVTHNQLQGPFYGFLNNKEG